MIEAFFNRGDKNWRSDELIVDFQNEAITASAQLRREDEGSSRS